MFRLRDVQNPQTLLFNRVQVDFGNCTFAGTGVGLWDPDVGLSLSGVLPKVQGEHPTRLVFGQPYFPDDRLQTIRLTAMDGSRSIAFHQGLKNQIGLARSGEFHVRIPQVTAIEHRAASSRQPTGHLVFEGEVDLRLPDPIKRTIQIGERTVRMDHRKGLDFKSDDGHAFVIRSNDDGTYGIWWALPPSMMSSSCVARWPIAIVRAWQILTNSDTQPLLSEIDDGRRRIRVVRARQKTTSLGPFSLINQSGRVQGKDLLLLTRFFNSTSTSASVASRLMGQCFDAAAATSWHASGLLIGTALEAALRTLYGFPFRESGPKSDFRFRTSLERFMSDYLSSEWATSCERARTTFNRVRHKAAHPDWITDGAGALSPEARRQMFDDLLFMSRFYGYMILAMAGIPEIEPRFPKPVSEWVPAVTLSTLK